MCVQAGAWTYSFGGQLYALLWDNSTGSCFECLVPFYSTNSKPMETLGGGVWLAEASHCV